MPWIAVSLLTVVAVIGLVFARTAMDRGAFELADLERQASNVEAHNRRLIIEIAGLENPGRIAPLADQMGMVPSNNPITLLAPRSILEVSTPTEASDQ